MAFDIKKSGVHELEFKYMPKQYVTGTIISVLGILTFIGLIVFTILRKKLSKKPQRVYAPDYFVLDDFDNPEDDNIETKELNPPADKDSPQNKVPHADEQELYDEMDNHPSDKNS